MKYIKYLTVFLTVLVISGCAAGNKYLTQIKESFQEGNKIVTLKLVNEYNEVYELADVIIGYGSHSFYVLESQAIEEEISSTDKKFNEKYKQYSKIGWEKNFLGIEYMTFTDEALLGMLADVYAMKVVTVDPETNKLIEINFKKSKIKLSQEVRQNIYYGFVDTSKYYEDREKDE